MSQIVLLNGPNTTQGAKYMHIYAELVKTAGDIISMVSFKDI